MTVVAADGQYVHPVTVDEFRIAAAETFDVIVEPAGQDAFTIFAQSMDRTGYARGTLARARRACARRCRRSTRASLLTMADMGHGGMGHDMARCRSRPRHATTCRASGRHAGAWPAACTHPAERDGQSARRHADDDADVAARRPGHRPARQRPARADLRRSAERCSPIPTAASRGARIELHLTGHMERFAWSFDGVKFSDAEPLRLTYGERLRIVLVNDTMMTHPIHLHGMWSDLEDDDGQVPGAQAHHRHAAGHAGAATASRADALGRWAYHCHLLFHMEAGMFREVRVSE